MSVARNRAGGKRPAGVRPEKSGRNKNESMYERK